MSKVSKFASILKFIFIFDFPVVHNVGIITINRTQTPDTEMVLLISWTFIQKKDKLNLKPILIDPKFIVWMPYARSWHSFLNLIYGLHDCMS